jgi:hypothetical protein
MWGEFAWQLVRLVLRTQSQRRSAARICALRDQPAFSVGALRVHDEAVRKAHDSHPRACGDNQILSGRRLANSIYLCPRSLNRGTGRLGRQSLCLWRRSWCSMCPLDSSRESEACCRIVPIKARGIRGVVGRTRPIASLVLDRARIDLHNLPVSADFRRVARPIRRRKMPILSSCAE